MTRGRKVLIIYTVISVLCLVGALLCFARISSLEGSVPSQLAWERWEKKNFPCTQVSCFFSAENGLYEDSFYPIRQSINTAVNASGVLAAGDARVWYDAYSTETHVSVSLGDTYVNARAFLTGGDYFKIHEADFTAGYFYNDASVMDDGIVIDKALAWKLFGGYALDGMSVEVNGIRCQVTGVVENVLGSGEQKAIGDEATLYIPYRLFARYGMAPVITCYEVVLPEPLDDFGIKTVKEALGMGNDGVETVDVGGRYSLIRNIKTLLSFDELVQRKNRIFFPYWENAARAVQSRAALITLLALVLLLFPVTDALIWLSVLWRGRSKLIEKIKKTKHRY